MLVPLRRYLHGRKRLKSQKCGLNGRFLVESREKKRKEAVLKVGVESGRGWETFIVYRKGQNTCKTFALRHPH